MYACIYTHLYSRVLAWNIGIRQLNYWLPKVLLPYILEWCVEKKLIWGSCFLFQFKQINFKFWGGGILIVYHTQKFVPLNYTFWNTWTHFILRNYNKSPHSQNQSPQSQVAKKSFPSNQYMKRWNWKTVNWKLKIAKTCAFGWKTYFLVGQLLLLPTPR